MIEIGSIVKYREPFIQDYTADWIGIVVADHSGGFKFLIEWNSGMKLWRHKDVLEVICK